MASTQTTFDSTQAQATEASLLISLASLDQEGFRRTLANLAGAFPAQSLIVATPDSFATPSQDGLRVVGYTPSVSSTASWTLTPADFLNAYELAQQHHAKAVLILGPEAQSLETSALQTLADAVLSRNVDLAMPRYTLPPRTGLVNSAILYPVTRALFGAHPRFPLALDLCVSARAAERLASVAQRFTAANQADALLWPVSEAAVANLAIAEVAVGPRTTPQPAGHDLNSLLAHIAGSLFTDIDAKAAYWQRARVAQPTGADHPGIYAASDPITSGEAQPMIESFRLAFSNLRDIWSLVLPPHSLLGLKRLSLLPPESFVMPDSLWARIVYDFLLAFRLRTINRGHLLGALTPLYLAWVASHLLQIGAGMDPEDHVEAVAAAFETAKPYLVSRWRWPDRFNP